jgi:hypothetical protein
VAPDVRNPISELLALSRNAEPRPTTSLDDSQIVQLIISLFFSDPKCAVLLSSDLEHFTGFRNVNF